MSCRYDRDAGDYLVDGEPCRHDDYGDPTHHCTARRTCSQHVGPRELTCARCVSRARRDIRTIRDIAPLMLPVALGAGVNSGAANLAGPAADYATFSARRRIAKRWIDDNIHQSARDWCDDPDCRERHFKARGGDRWHKRGIENAYADLVEDDDELHPYSVLTRWQAMLAEDYDHPLPEKMSTTDAAGYLDRVLARVAQDDEQDFPLLAREVRKCRSNLEAVLRDSDRRERGAPCPLCAEDEKFVRLARVYGHWCEDADCDRLHYLDTAGDQWVCPRDRAHSWSHEDYERWVVERGA